MNRLFCVIPCYNEQEVLPETSRRLKEKIEDLVGRKMISSDSRILLVNDGSKDDTWNIIKKLHEEDEVFQGINLSKNMGHQNALLAGLMTAKDLCDMAISLDADLQDDIDAIDAMVDKFNKEDCEVVYGVRSKRATDTFFKRFTAESYYKLIDAMGAKTVYNHADYRLLSRRALQALSEFGEVNLFLRGIVPMLGFKSDIVYYERAERFAGESKYPLKKMLSFAIEGITSLSTKPIKMITELGFFIFFVSIAVFIYSLVRYFTGHTIQGWTTTVLSVWAIGGLIMISLGVIGEYIGKIYLETKNRPRFIIESYIGDKEDEEIADCVYKR
ncbi:MAG: glycosyltransferase family 2 protein [Butyrivibrio sp.]|uniref:Glycosyltransferase involved in cell wall bisynthesis n=1 Tax=Butyrivibrio hungatei TaxID=185008 RepID=A0A1G5B5Y6_9FIRM|nr:glycosyltransferase family 2 protein [Butyrivibrio hungatei]MBQ2609810.1 glycosyltransferase family 2 protein [Butyrivibrio sp.]MBR4358680.1 glycosyltransferase family 2 protein [Butyrivibrio sp.]MEE3469932.1 glycosyltransferase family 2 protein [Butyrivibrio hungatei]SCX85495.1 Glycosyltransferase involved in cell wall bisynthesis [Butyrivibrio hungatei]